MADPTTNGGAPPTTSSADVANANALNNALSAIRTALTDTSTTSASDVINQIATAITHSLLGGAVGASTNVLLKSKTSSSGGSAGSLQGTGIVVDAVNNVSGIGTLNMTG